MSKVTTDMIRNIALIGHSGEGKTSLAEAMLFNAKSIDRLGKVEDGNTTMDFDAEEINRKISISLAVAYANWKGNKINILDCPGFFDFEGEVVSALSVADSAIIVTSASGSLSVGTEKMLEMCTDRKVPAMVFINQVNKDNADFRGTYNAIEQAFGSKVLPIELPVIEGGKMTGWVDILTGKAYKLSAPEQEIDVPADMKSEVEELKGRLVELAAETDDALIEKYFEGEELTAEELEKGVRQAILNDSLMPLMAGNATTSVGVANLMDKICKFMPSPVRDVKKTSTEKTLHATQTARSPHRYSKRLPTRTSENFFTSKCIRAFYTAATRCSTPAPKNPKKQARFMSLKAKNKKPRTNSWQAISALLRNSCPPTSATPFARPTPKSDLPPSTSPNLLSALR